jgi:formylglycine-generating enzyme required for sulfatase activity
MAATILGLIGWINQEYLKQVWRWAWTEGPFVTANITPNVLTASAERALQPGDSFRECTPRQQEKDYCPDMIVVPAGMFSMGSPATEVGRRSSESPQHPVTITEPFAVSKYQLTFDEWDTCVAFGDCTWRPQDADWGRGRRPVIYVSWDDAQQYFKWLSKVTGKPYRLLTEAEYEYATRGGRHTVYPWGDEIGTGNANCKGCGSRWDNRQTAPVGSFAANAFGLYDMVGNVWEWVEDCWHDDYNGAPPDGSAWGGNCINHVIRGGYWFGPPDYLRSADRSATTPVNRGNYLGFRVARTLFAP